MVVPWYGDVWRGGVWGGDSRMDEVEGEGVYGEGVWRERKDGEGSGGCTAWFYGGKRMTNDHSS